MRVFLAFQAENLRLILHCALIGRILTNELACQRSAVRLARTGNSFFYLIFYLIRLKGGCKELIIPENRVFEEQKLIEQEAQNVAIAM